MKFKLSIDQTNIRNSIPLNLKKTQDKFLANGCVGLGLVRGMIYEKADNGDFGDISKEIKDAILKTQRSRWPLRTFNDGSHQNVGFCAAKHLGSRRPYDSIEHREWLANEIDGMIFADITNLAEVVVWIVPAHNIINAYPDIFDINERPLVGGRDNIVDILDSLL